MASRNLIRNYFIRRKANILEVICMLFIILFVYAALTKFMEGDRFYNNIRNSPILGGRTVASIGSWLIPLIGVTIALLIAWRKTRLIGLFGALSLMFFFTGYTMAILFFAPYIPCSCSGVISLLSWEQHLVFNIVFLALAVLGIVLFLKERKMSDRMEGLEVS
ncbi:MAG TPA: MauE/DoxX family redox-associated membrane protein [Arenibacter sp.]|nr:MauE/DoxX family redox-associated membrane protein [Arenibacter sp.]